MAEDKYLRQAALRLIPGIPNEEDDDYIPSWSSRNKAMRALTQGVPQRPLGEEITGFDPELARRIFSQVRRPFDPREERAEFTAVPISRGEDGRVGLSESRYLDAGASFGRDQELPPQKRSDTVKQYVTGEHLKALGWQNVSEDMLQDLNHALEKYGINTPERIRHFISQASKESGLGQWTTEGEFGDIGYLDRQPYGRKYRGAGYLHVTWPENYERLAQEVNDPEVVNQGADYVAAKYPWTASGFWWKDNNMNDLVDSGASVEAVTRRVNGDPSSDPKRFAKWLESLEERKKYYDIAAGIFR